MTRMKNEFTAFNLVLEKIYYFFGGLKMSQKG